MKRSGLFLVAGIIVAAVAAVPAVWTLIGEQAPLWLPVMLFIVAGLGTLMAIVAFFLPDRAEPDIRQSAFISGPISDRSRVVDNASKAHTFIDGEVRGGEVRGNRHEPR